MKKLSVFVFIVFSLTLLFSSSTFAQKNAAKRGIMKERVFDKINLTETQEREIEDFRYAQQLEAIDLHADLEKNQLMLKELFDADEIDEGAIMDIVEKNNAIHDKLSTMRVKMHLKMNSVLTAEQKEELKSLPRFGSGFGLGMGLGICRNGEPGIGRGFGRNGKPGMGRGFGRDDDGRGMGRRFNDFGNCRFRGF